MNRYFLALLLTGTVLCGQIPMKALAQQKAPVLLTIGNEKVTKSEFEGIYNKNNQKQSSKPDEKTLRDYLNLYVNFRLKVQEAERLGLDTVPAFVRELATYRKQLSQPYLTDKEVTEKLIAEAYARSKKEVRASHILITCADNASAKDTLVAYNRIMSLRKRIVDGKESFATVAKTFSDDPSAKQNLGDLGFFTAFTMVYPFESVAYNTPKGQVSMPVRTKFGYHLLKVIDDRPAQGEVKASHILIRIPKNTLKADSIQIKAKIDEVYKRLNNGESFEELAKVYSDDKSSAQKGGLMGSFGTGKMVPEFEAAAFALQNDGDYSAPFMSSYGWHIVKRLEKKEIPGYNELLPEIKSKIARDSRSELNRQSFIAKLKKEYAFKEDIKARDEVVSKLDSTLFIGKWDPAKGAGLTKTIFIIKDEKYTQEEFINYIANNQFRIPKDEFSMIVKKLYNEFVDDMMMEYEQVHLESKYEEFRKLMQEYHDGILLFELTDKMVWSKAVKDTIGLETFFNTNKEKYKWNTRLDAVIYTVKDEGISKEVRKLLKNKAISSDSLMTIINQLNPLNLTIQENKFEKGDNSIIDGIEWKKGITDDMVQGKNIVFVRVKEKLAPAYKTLDEVRGAVIAEYQNYLEKQWVEELRSKNSFTVDEPVFKSLLN